MSPVKNQGLCGADYVFAPVATFEYLTIKNNDSLTLLSEQSLIDCDASNKGCTAGSVSNSMLYATKLGVSDGTKYVYTSGTSGKAGPCQKSYPSVWKLNNICYGNLGGQEENLQNIIYTYGPMVVTMDGSDTNLSNYKLGVFTSTKCSSSARSANLAVVRTASSSKLN